MCKSLELFYAKHIKSNKFRYTNISIELSHVAKLFHSLVLLSIRSAINLVLVKEEHGVRPGRLTTPSNLVFTNYVFDASTKCSQNDVIYTDLRSHQGF